jgi:hypothetical protein
MFKNKKNLKILSFITIQFIFSYILLINYTEGDFIVYNKFYNEINNSSLFSSFSIAQDTITGIEPISVLIFWIFSNLGVKKLFSSIVLNIILAIGILKITQKYKIPNSIAFLLFTNFYLIVLFTAAERLKISYIFIIWGFLFCSKYKIFFYILSIFSHFQNIILFSSLYISKIIIFREKKIYIKLEDLYILSGVIFFLFLFIINLNYILYDLNVLKYLKSKFELFQTYPITSLYKLLLLNILIYFILSKKLIRIQFLFIIFYIFSLMFGPHRINMIAVTAILGILISEKKIKHPLVILLLLYFSFSSIPFIISIFTSNHGFEYLLWLQ